MIALLAGAFGCVFLGFMQSWIWFLLLFVFAKSAYSLSLVIYDSMLTDITSEERMDEVSAQDMLSISEAVFRLFAVCCWYCFMIKWEFRCRQRWGFRFSGSGLVDCTDGSASEIIPSDTQSETDSTRRTVRCAKIGTDRF